MRKPLTRSDYVAAHNYILGRNTARHLRLVAEQKRAATDIALNLPVDLDFAFRGDVAFVTRSSPIIDGTILLALGPGSWKHRSPAAR